VARPERIDRYKEILASFIKDKRPASEAPSLERDGMTRYIRNREMAVTDRIDILLRMLEAGWISDEAARPVLLQLNDEGIRIWELESYAANRVVDVLLRLVGRDAARDTLLTAFAASPRVAAKVIEAYVAIGTPDVLEQGLHIGLRQNAPDPAGEFTSASLARAFSTYGERIEELGRTLDRMVVEWRVEVVWQELATDLHDAWRGLADLWLTASSGELKNVSDAVRPRDQALERMGSFWRRCVAFAPTGQRDGFLQISVDPRLASVAEPLLETIFAGQQAHGYGDAWTALASGLPEKALLRSLDIIAERHWGWPAEADTVEYLSDQLNVRTEVIEWAAERAVRAVQQNPAQASRWAGLLDRISPHVTNEELRARVNGVREQVFLGMCRQIRLGRPVEATGRVMDSATLGGLVTFVGEVAQEHEAALAREREKARVAEQSQHEAEERSERLRHDLVEVQNSFRRSEAEIAFRERKRLLTDVAETVAQIDDLARQRDSKEVAAVVTRLNSLLVPYRVEPFGHVGELLQFDAAWQELQSPGAVTGQSVTVTRRGYSLTGADGVRVLLVAAKVRP
jgi:molecular chaperone GrpE (heat shock protein)